MEKLGHKVLTFSSVTTDKMQKEISIKKTIQLSDIRIKLQKCLINGHLPDCLKSAKSYYHMLSDAINTVTPWYGSVCVAYQETMKC